MLRDHPVSTVEVQFLADDQAVIGARLLAALQEAMYSNRMHIAPRRIRQVVQDEIASLTGFLATRDLSPVVARGQQLMREGLGQRSVINLTSALRLACWDIAAGRNILGEVVPLIENYTSALLSGYMATYEEEQRREQQRTHEAFVRSLASA